MVNGAAWIMRLGCVFFAIVGMAGLVRTATEVDAVAPTGIAYDLVLKLVSTANPPLRKAALQGDLKPA